MEQKQSKQRNMKSSTEKSSSSTENMVLKAESVVEVKSKVVKGAKAPVSTTQTAVPVQSTKGKKASTVVQQVEAASAPASKSTNVSAPVQTAGQVKGKRVVQAAVDPVNASVPVQQAAVVKVSKVTKKAVKAVENTVQKAAGTVQKAGAKPSKAVKKAVTEPAVKSTKKVQKVVAEEGHEEKQMDEKLRYFKLYYNDNICGRYSGKKPKQAANKAFSSIIKDMRKTDNKEGVNIDITFTIKECTRNSFHKEYKYVGKRLLLKSPVKVTIENGDGTSKDIVYKYHNELKKAPKV
jgi:hypothetical protein